MRRVLLASASFFVLTAPAFAQTVPYDLGLLPSYKAQQEMNVSPARAKALAAQAIAYEAQQQQDISGGATNATAVAYGVQQQPAAAPVYYAPASASSYGTQASSPAYAAPAYAAPYAAPQQQAYVAAPGYVATSTYTTSTTTAPAAQAQVAMATPSYGTINYGNTAPAYVTASAAQAPVQPTATYDASMAAPQPSSNYASAPSYGTQQGYATQAQTYAAPVPAAQVQGYQVASAQQPQAYAAYGNAMYPAQNAPAYTYETYQQTQTMQQPVAEQAPVVIEEERAVFANEPTRDIYLGLRSGLTLPDNTAFKVGAATIEQEYKPGWMVGLMVGKSFGGPNSWLSPRLEADINYSQTTVDIHNVSGVKVEDPNAYGTVSNYNFMVNGFLDFKVARNFIPYVGGGVGLGFSDFDRHGTNAGGVVMDDNSVAFAWQAAGGVGIPLTRSALLDIGYRFQRTEDLELTSRNGTKSDSVSVGNHIITLGLRQNF
jgi:opacity protein-like surface antigen